MNLSTHDAWRKAARLIALCLGYSEKQQRRLYKEGQTFNEVTNTHEISFKLYIKHPVETSMYKPLVNENKNIKKRTLLQELYDEIEKDKSDIASKNK